MAMQEESSDFYDKVYSLDMIKIIKEKKKDNTTNSKPPPK